MIDDISKKDLELLKEIYPDTYQEEINKINQGYPIQYLIGYVDFYGNKILVNEDVLIPRFETEYLVQDTIKLIKEYIKNPKVIDVCSGSGCIAISLAKELNINVDALDISSKCIDMIKENAKINKCNINCIEKDIKDYSSNQKYNVLISNPPYVKLDEKIDERCKYEPSIALFAKDEGLEFYKIILEKSKSLLDDNNIIAFEIGATLKDDIIKIIKNYYPDSNIISKKDLNSFDRYIYVINS